MTRVTSPSPSARTVSVGRDRLIGEGDLRGRMVESSVGASLLARAPEEGFGLFWWREGNDEVDFVVQKGASLAAIEVKGGTESSQSGMAKLLSRHPEAKRTTVGGSSAGSCDLEEFLLGEVPLFS